MTTGKHQIATNGEEPPASAGATRKSQPNPQRAPLDPWYRRVSFWRSIAGMAVALALGCAAVALETASELSSRSTFFHHRLESLRGRISELRTKAADAEQHLAAVRSDQAARTNVNRVLSAKDVVVLRLRPGLGVDARGIAAISKQSGIAIVEISGLPAAEGQKYVMWWQPAQGLLTKAAELKPDDDGRLSVAVQMPPRGATIAGAVVTLEKGGAADRPNGKLILKGELPMPKVLG